MFSKYPCASYTFLTPSSMNWIHHFFLLSCFSEYYPWLKNSPVVTFLTLLFFFFSLRKFWQKNPSLIDRPGWLGLRKYQRRKYFSLTQKILTKKPKSKCHTIESATPDSGLFVVVNVLKSTFFLDMAERNIALKSPRQLGLGLSISQCKSCSNTYVSPTDN